MKVIVEMLCSYGNYPESIAACLDLISSFPIDKIYQRQSFSQVQRVTCRLGITECIDHGLTRSSPATCHSAIKHYQQGNNNSKYISQIKVGIRKEDGDNDSDITA